MLVRHIYGKIKNRALYEFVTYVTDPYSQVAYAVLTNLN